MTIQQISRTNEPQSWLCDGVPGDVIDTQGLSTLHPGDFITNTQTKDRYEILTCTKDLGNFGVYTDVTYQIIITNLNINNYLPA
jgi:hypothetical protein